LLGFLILVVLSAQGDFRPVGTTISAGPGATGRAISTMLTGIVSFARWPAQSSSTQFCLVGPTRMAKSDLDAFSASAQGAEIVSVQESATTIPASCGILYFGAVERRIIARLVPGTYNRSVLTIAEDDPLCRTGTMICLHAGNTEISFELNLDAISRSRVSVDPRVLRLSRGGMQ
jgi:hypothetical protein